jgi:hypothetical protein
VEVITGRIAGTPLEPELHSVTGNGKRDGLKSFRIGQSAAEPLGGKKYAERRVQRLGNEAFPAGNLPTSTQRPLEDGDIVFSPERPGVGG